MSNNNQLYMGIDGGGTKTRVCIQDEVGNFLGEGLGGSGNPSYGMEVVTGSILTATKQALAAAGLHESDMSRLVVGAGLGGLHLPRYQQMVESWQHPFAALYSTNDAITATIGAHNGQDGGIIIIGTGFSSSGVVGGVEHNIGGYGFSLGETCSGYWIGHQAITSVLKAIDDLAPQTQLSALLSEHIGGESYEMAEKISHFSVKDIAALASLVFHAAENGDSVAHYILAQSRDFTVTVAEKLLAKGCQKISLIGGVATHLVPMLPEHIRSCLKEPIYPPEIGAILYAKFHHNS